jgi:hypothetical protein
VMPSRGKRIFVGFDRGGRAGAEIGGGAVGSTSSSTVHSSGVLSSRMRMKTGVRKLLTSVRAFVLSEHSAESGNRRGSPSPSRSLLPAFLKAFAVAPLAVAAADENDPKTWVTRLDDRARDPRTSPSLATAFNEYEAGKSEDDVKYASHSVIDLASAGKLTDQGVIDALWSCFSRLHASQAKSINLVVALHDAVLAVKDPSYGAKAVDKLAAPVDPNCTPGACPQGAVCVEWNGQGDARASRAECVGSPVTAGCTPTAYQCTADPGTNCDDCKCSICGAGKSICRWDPFYGTLASVVCE